MPHAGTDPATLVLTFLEEVQHILLLHLMEAAHEVHHSQSPIDTTHSQVLCHTVFLENINRSFYNCGTFWGRLKMTISCKFNKLLFEKYSD